MPRRKDQEMLAEMKIKRINHIASLCKKKGWTKNQFIREAMYHTPISDTTLEKAYGGETDLSMDTVEQLAKLFKVGKDEILESIF
jgi:Cro/C1-type helix-turn-helix DNA-binding protein